MLQKYIKSKQKTKKKIYIKDYALCLGNISKDFTINNKKINMVKRKSNFFFVNFIPIDTNDIIDIHRYLMKGKEYKIMFDLIKICLWDY